MSRSITESTIVNRLFGDAVTRSQKREDLMQEKEFRDFEEDAKFEEIRRDKEYGK
jgi:hypothetical protein